MKKELLGIISLVVLLLYIYSGLFTDIVNFLTWLFFLQNSSPDISIACEIIVRALTFLVSYGLVGIIFNAIGLFNSKVMSIVYFIVSTLIGFILTYIVMTIEKYLLIIEIILGLILAIIIAYFIVYRIISNKTLKRGVE